MSRAGACRVGCTVPEERTPDGGQSIREQRETNLHASRVTDPRAPDPRDGATQSAASGAGATAITRVSLAVCFAYSDEVGVVCTRKSNVNCTVT